MDIFENTYSCFLILLLKGQPLGKELLMHVRYLCHHPRAKPVLIAFKLLMLK